MKLHLFCINNVDMLPFQDKYLKYLKIVQIGNNKLNNNTLINNKNATMIIFCVFVLRYGTRYIIEEKLTAPN